MRFTNKIVVVTGAGSGIGEATAVQFAGEGAGVVAVDRDPSRLQIVREKCVQAGGEPLLVTADVSRDDEAQKIIDEAINKFEKIDVLVNCAGIYKLGRILDGSVMQTYDEVMNVNLRSVILMTTLAAPHLVKSKGNIVNISSVGAVQAPPLNNLNYYISKAGVSHFTRGAALELAGFGVRVNAINPGPVRTRIIENCGVNLLWEDLVPATALKRLSQAQEIADMVLYLSNDQARGITGSTFCIDNGYCLN
ncbi:3-oxoacyl-[acyl-carrier-protein] reductase FabG-like [Aphomia sociella]